MAYDEDLADRIRISMRNVDGVTEKKMFGGLAFLVSGNMAAVASGQGGLMLRCDPTETAQHLQQPGTAPMVMRDREMSGWLRVADEAVANDATLDRWVAIGTAHAKSLPAK